MMMMMNESVSGLVEHSRRLKDLSLILSREGMIQNPGQRMGKSLGRKYNFEEVCFQLGIEYW